MEDSMGKFTPLRLRLKFLDEPEVQLKCSTCGKAFEKRNNLAIHIRNVHNKDRVKLFHCSFCPRAFSRPEQRKKHEEKHTGDKSHKCQYCRRTFDSRKLKVSHERVHTGEKPYECVECGNRYREQKTLKQHVRTEHSKGEQHY